MEQCFQCVVFYGKKAIFDDGSVIMECSMTVPPLIDHSPEVKLQHAANMHRPVIANPAPLGITIVRVVFGLIALALTAAPLFVVHYLRTHEEGIAHNLPIQEQAEHRNLAGNVEAINAPSTERAPDGATRR
jgi:hypothetical protein